MSEGRVLVGKTGGKLTKKELAEVKQIEEKIFKQIDTFLKDPEIEKIIGKESKPVKKLPKKKVAKK